MNKSTYPLKLPISIKRAAQRLAKEEGVSLNQWIAVAVGQKVGVVDTAAEFFRKRSEGTDLAHMRKILDAVPDNPPDEQDRLD